MTPPPADHAARFRPEIEGLRGLAVALVVLFHAGLGFVAGGFIGVDVFFVISGFLITGLLLREREGRGRISLTAFYARRVRRLVPAAAVVLAVSAPAAYLVLDPLNRVDALLDGLAAALSVANIRFAAAAGDYFAPTGIPSPFLHFWSLAVEEQFYLVWPALILLAARGARPRLAVGRAIAVVLVASLVASLVLTHVAAGWAFYSLPTRAWQLALGGLLAVAAPYLVRLPASVALPIGWLGLLAVAAAAFGFDGSLAYPGVAAVLPTVGAAALVLSGNRRGGPGAVLTLGPLRFLGRISYSLYLWHWPILILPAWWLAGQPLPLVARVGLVGLSLLVATASCLFVEEPFRRMRRPMGVVPALRTVAAGAGTLIAVGVLTLGLSTAGARDLERLGVPRAVADERPLVPAPARSTPPGSQRPAPDGLATGDPSPVPSIAAGTSPPTSPPADPFGAPPPPSEAPPMASGPGLPGGVRPPVAAAREDEEPLRRDRCLGFEGATEPPDCVYGDPSAEFTVALVGDSHGSHWFPALADVAERNGWQIRPMLKVSCPFIDMPVRSLQLKREYGECAAFREATLRRLDGLRPDLTIVAQSKWIFPVDPDDKSVARVGAALARTVARVPGQAVIMVDTPHAATDVPPCLAAHPDDIAACSTPRARAFSGVGAIEAAASAAAGVPTIDLTNEICSTDRCPAVVNGMIVYRDEHHLTATFSRSLGPALDRALREALGH